MSVDTHEAEEAKVPLWNDPKVRALVSQAILIALVVWIGYEIVNNTLVNLEKRKIASGFDFLNTTASFGIIQSLIPYSEASSYGRVFLVGLLNTILVGVIGIILATVIGFVVGIMRLSNNWVVSKIATVYVETLRNLPLLLQIFFWYFGVLSALPSARNSLAMLGNALKTPKYQKKICSSSGRLRSVST